MSATFFSCSVNAHFLRVVSSAPTSKPWAPTNAWTTTAIATRTPLTLLVNSSTRRSCSDGLSNGSAQLIGTGQWCTTTRRGPSGRCAGSPCTRSTRCDTTRSTSPDRSCDDRPRAAASTKDVELRLQRDVRLRRPEGIGAVLGSRNGLRGRGRARRLRSTQSAGPTRRPTPTFLPGP